MLNLGLTADRDMVKDRDLHWLLLYRDALQHRSRGAAPVPLDAC